MQCDINISQLQEDHISQIQKLHAEKEHLIQCIVHVYYKNNPGRSKQNTFSSRTLFRSSRVESLDDESVSHLAHEGLQFKESGSGRMRRCVSLDRIASKGTFSGRQSIKGSKLGSGTGPDGFMRNSGLRGTRHHSQSIYLDLVQRQGTLGTRLGLRGRSTSLQSLHREVSSDSTSDPPLKRNPREAKAFAARHFALRDPGRKVQARALLQSSSTQPSVISDLIQILRCLSKQPVSAPAGSHIPVLKRLNGIRPHAPAKRVHRVVEWKSLHDLTEEFDDEYTPVRVKVDSFSNPYWLKQCSKVNAT